MKCSIHYFSATGNTKAAALIAASVLREAGCAADVSAIRDSGRWDGECDLWVVATPVFNFKPSLPALEFAASASVRPGMPSVALFTHGGTVDMAPVYMAGAFRKAGARPFDWVELMCEDSWPVLRRFFLAGAGVGNPDKDSLARFRAFWKGIPGRIAAGQARKSWFRMPSPFSLLSPFYHRSALGRLWFPISVDMRKCTRCGKCVRGCPTGRMKIAEFPRPKGECTGCYGCVNICPEEAVNTWFTSGAPRYRGDFLARTSRDLGK